MNSDQNRAELASGDELTPQESVAMDALLSESIGNRMPPEFTEVILKKYHDGPTVDEKLRVSVTPVSRSQRQAERRRKSRRKWATISGLAMAGSLAAFFWARPNINLNTDFGTKELAVAKAKPDQAGVPKTDLSFDSTVTDDSMPVERQADGIFGPTQVAEAAKPAGLGTPKSRKLESPKPAKAAMVLNGNKAKNLSPEQKVKQTAKRRSPKSLSSVKLVSKTIDNDFKKYWKSAGVLPTAEASATEIAERLSATLGVKVPLSALANYDAAAKWLLKKDVGTAIARTWWTQVTDGNFKTLPSDAQRRLQSGFSRHLEPDRFFNGYLFRLISRTDAASNDFYTAMVPSGGDATHPDMITNLASLTMNLDVSCTRCHDSMIGGNLGQQDYWGFAAVIDRGLAKKNGKLVRVENKTVANVFYETVDRRGEVAKPEVPNRWLGIDSSVRGSKTKLDSIVAWSTSLKSSPLLAEGIVNSLWKLVHGRPLRGQAAHPMSAPMSDELLKVQRDLVDDLVSSGFDIRRTLALVMMSPPTRRSSPESLRDIWATDQSEAHKKVIAFAGALPAAKPVPMLAKVEQSMRAIGSVMSTDGRNLLAQIGEGGTTRSRPKTTQTLAWDFPDQADGLPVQWLGTVSKLDEKIAHLCYLAGLEQVPQPIRLAASAMQKAGVDESTLLHRVWWMAKGN